MSQIAVRFASACLALSALTTGCSGAPTDGAGAGAQAASHGQNDAVLLVSDIDDTIKRTNVLDKVQAVINGAQSHNAFSAMSLLYTSWHNETSTPKQIAYLSAAPGPLVLAGIRFLENSSFPGDSPRVSDSVVSGRSLSESAGEFKTKKLYAIYDASVAAGKQPGTVILIGDNGEQDMIAYGNYIAYVASKGGNIDHIYSFIHHVYDSPKGSEIRAPHRPFVTAADLAVDLANLGLVSDATLTTVLRAVASDAASQPDTVVPPYMKCAQFDAWPTPSTSAGANDWPSVKGRVATMCTPSKS